MPDIEPKQGGWFIVYINGLPSSIVAGMDKDSVTTTFRTAMLGQGGVGDQKITVKSIHDAPINDVVRITATSLAILTGVLMSGAQRGPRGLA
jgi:hypothetical protein